MKRITVLFSFLALSCATVKHAASTECIETNRDVRTHIDSVVQSQVAAQIERLAVIEGETVTDIIMFDTSKPPADSTGLPPVKALLRKQTRHASRSREQVATQMGTDVRVETETTDHSTEVSQTEQIEEKKPSVGMGVLRLGAGVLLLAVVVFAVWVFYKRIKR